MPHPAVINGNFAYTVATIRAMIALGVSGPIE
ncbi:hypothetical protein ACUXD4_000561 [Staphylococcus lugdunensis]